MTKVMTKVMDRANRALPRGELAERIYRAAIVIFRDKGFDAATVEEIARAAGVAKGTIFNFFPTKGAILLRYYEELDAEFGRAMGSLSPEDPKAALIDFYGKAEALLRKEGPLAEAVFRQIALDPDLGNADADSGEKDRNQMTAFFRACQESGTLSEAVPPTVAAHVVSDLWSATVLDWLRTGQRYSLKLRLATKLDAVFKGLAPVARSMISAMSIMLAVFLLPVSSRAAPQNDARPLQGLYYDAQGYAAVVPFAEFGQGLFFIDYTSGRTGPVVTRADGFAIGIGMKTPNGEAGTLSPSFGGLRLDADGQHRTMRRIAITRAPFVVPNGAVRLAGEIVRRADQNPIGGIVIVHGSNDEPRTMFGPWLAYLVARGWAVAVFDKRGSGESTGDWRTGDFATLASDVRAVGKFLRAQDVLAGKPVGLVGISQAGWIMPLAADQGGFNFIVSLAGAAVTPAEQSLEFTERQLEAYGLPKDEIAKALAYYRLDLDVSIGRKPWSAIEAAYRAASAAKAEWLIAPPEPEGSPSRGFLGRVAGFDPAPHWAKLHIPVLAVFGGKDFVVPEDPNRALLEKDFLHNGNPATKVVTIADVNHVGMIAATGTIAEYPTLDHFDPAYFATFGDWLAMIARH